MTHIELNEQEAQTLSEVLESYLSDLRTEMVATEQKEWRADMKRRETFVRELLGRLTAGKA